MKIKIIFILTFLTFPLLQSCNKKEDDDDVTVKEPVINRIFSHGDIIVSSITNDNILLFSSKGIFKRVLLQLTNSTETIGSMAFMNSTKELLVSIDGTPDRIIAISSEDGEERTFRFDANLTGTIRGILQLDDSREIIINEGTTTERISETEFRVTNSTVWPSSTIVNSQQFSKLTNGTFLSCSSTAGVKIYPDSIDTFTEVASVTGPVGATASFGCVELNDGSIVVGWNGTTNDYIYKYSSTLTDQSVILPPNSNLPNPRGMAVSKSGNLLIADGTNHYVLELKTNGTILRTIGLGLINSPQSVVVVPEL